MDRFLLLRKLPPFKNRNEILKNDQSTTDIINEILKAHDFYLGDYLKICSYFKGINDIQTAKNCFNFLKKNIIYVIDSGENQIIKSPGAIIATGKADCKCYSLFTGGILSALNIPFCYRFSSYQQNNKTPGHVFIVMNPGTKKEIWIDPVLNSFNQKKQYTYKTDRMINKISGIGKVSAKKAAKKAAGKTVGQKLKKGTKVILKVAAAPARNAFLLLVKLNFLGLATKLNNAYIKKPSELKNLWEGKIGGKINSLVTNIKQGAKKKKIGACDCEQNQIGVITAATAAAAAAPIIAIVTSWLKKQGILDESGQVNYNKLAELANKELNKKVQDLADDKLAPEAAAAAENEVAVNDIVDESPNKNLNLLSNDPLPDPVVKDKSSNTLYYVAAAAALFFIIKK
jgi:hypothetical protein